MSETLRLIVALSLTAALLAVCAVTPLLLAIRGHAALGCLAAVIAVFVWTRLVPSGPGFAQGVVLLLGLGVILGAAIVCLAIWLKRSTPNPTPRLVSRGVELAGRSPAPRGDAARPAGRSMRERPWMIVREETDEALIAAIDSAPRAMAFLTVPWSCPERTARADFRKAVARLSEIGWSIEAFLVDEESAAAQRWLASLGSSSTHVGVGVPRGWGSVLWLEHGRLVACVERGGDERAVGMIARSKTLWGSRGATWAIV